MQSMRHSAFLLVLDDYFSVCEKPACAGFFASSHP